MITMYYGNSTMSSRQNPSGVWNNNYKAVWHMNQNPFTSNILDSTSNNYDLTTTGFTSDTRFYDGKLGASISVDGSNDYFYINSIDGPVNDLTFQTWFTPDNTIESGSSEMDFFRGNSLTRGHPTMRFTTSGTVDVLLEVTTDDSEGSYGIKNSWAGGSWFQFTYVRSISMSRAYHYVNGIQDVLDTDGDNASPHLTWTRFSILAYIDGSRIWGPGAISEFRILSFPLSADWINTEFQNQNDPNLFYAVSTEQLVNNVPPKNNYFNYFKIITIDHNKVVGSGSHVNFPLLISLIDNDLRYDVQNDGDDIAFSIDGKWLDHQIENFNQSYSPTQAQLIAWVRLPFLSTIFDINITMYYGNSTMSSREKPSRVWCSEYVGVWHLNENPSGTPPQIKDSTVPTSDGSSSGVMIASDQISGMIDGALDFDGNDDFVDFGNTGELQITGEITVQVWFKADIFIDNDYLVAKYGGTGSRGWDISLDDDPAINPDGWIMFRYSPDGTNIITTGYERVKVGKWYYVVAIFKPNDYSKFFINGTEVAMITAGVPPSMYDPPLPLRIARRSDDSAAWFDGIIDEVRVSNIARSNGWITTEYNNQYNPSSFYSVGSEQSMKPAIYIDAQINAVDLYGNFLPNVTISMYQNTELIEQDITDINGSVSFTNVIEGIYNFTATISSNIATITELINFTSQGILLDQAFQIVNLICNVNTYFFEVIDIDNELIESGWIIVGNATHLIKKCVIDPSGHTKFWWVAAPPSTYNYTIYYDNAIYNPPTVKLTSGYITTINETIQVQVNLTTVEFTILAFDPPTPVSGVKLKINLNDPLGLSIVNLTTDLDGKATLRWLTSFQIGGDYCVQIEFFGINRKFNQSVNGPAEVYNFSFTLINKVSFEFRVEIFGLSNFHTELLSLNPTDYIEVEWGTLLKLRTLFNVSKVEAGYESLLGPTYADSMTYTMLLRGISIKSGIFSKENGNEGRHFIEINTKQLDSAESYVIIISAYKSGYIIPSDLILQLNILDNELELNQSNNDDSDTSVYWLDPVNMTLNSYGRNSETLTLENLLFQNIDHKFEFLISDIENHWNISKIVFNIYNISWNVLNVSKINITIGDPFGNFYIFHSSNHSGWDYFGGTWTGITLNLNKASQTYNNSFQFEIDGSFNNTVDVIADAYFIRDSINVQYSKFNVSSEISLLTEVEGWTINSVTFEIFECYNTSN